MVCPSCERIVCRIARSLGAAEASADYGKGSLDLRCAENFDTEALSSALKSEGYTLLQREEEVSIPLRVLRVLLPISVAAVLVFLAFSPHIASFFPALPEYSQAVGHTVLFLAGVTTSLHCIAMCGGINLMQSLYSSEQENHLLLSNVLYNLGRVCSYTAIGMLAGFAGTAITPSPETRGLIMFIAGMAMIIMGLRLSGYLPILRRIRLPSCLAKHSAFHGKADRRKGAGSSLIVGLLNGFMPCGPLQAMQLYALSSGSAAEGALSMFLFASGTVPVMLLAGILGGRLNRRHAGKIIQVSALIVVVLGVAMLRNGAALSGLLPTAFYPSGKTNTAQTVQDVQNVHSELDYGAYPTINVQKGIPVRWNLHADEEKLNGCNNEITIPALGLSRKLVPGDNIIEFTPQRSGRIPYSCWMGMLYGSIIVTDEKGEVPQAAEEPLPASGRACSCCIRRNEASAASSSCPMPSSSSSSDKR